jgi:hypothetical protein
MLDLKQRSDKARLRSWDVFKSLYTLERSVAPLLHLKCLCCTSVAPQVPVHARKVRRGMRCNTSVNPCVLRCCVC